MAWDGLAGLSGWVRDKVRRVVILWVRVWTKRVHSQAWTWL